MKVGHIRGPRDAALQERATPTACGDVVLIETSVIPMCTEWRDWRDGRARDDLGHEAVGVVADAASSTRLRAGDRVIVMPHSGCGTCPACREGEYIHCRAKRDLLAETGSETGIGTYAEYLLKPDYLALQVPDDLRLEHAAAAICALGPTFTAVRRTRLAAGETALVSGCGAVGLGGIVNACAVGARVIALELHPYRIELARRLGAEVVLDPRRPDLAEALLELTGGQGVDVAIETSNTEAGAANVSALTRPRGRIAFVSWTGSLTVPSIVGAGHEVHGCWHWNHERHAAEMFTRIRQVAPSLDLLMTHAFPLSDLGAAFALQERGACGKVLLYPAAATG